VQDDDDGKPIFPFESLDQIQDPDLVGDVEVARGFIEE